MNLKKFALKGLIILAVCVALCMFFSGTIKTISTAKVKLVTPKNGKLEERVALSGKLTFLDVEPISVSVDQGLTLTVTKVNTRVGYFAEKGDVLVTAEVTGYETAMQEYEKGYSGAAEQLLALESENSDIRVRRTDEEYATAYYALRDARQTAVRLEIELDALLKQTGNLLPEEGYPEAADEALINAIDMYREAAYALETAQAAFDRASRYSVDPQVWNYLTQKKNYQDQMEEYQNRMRALSELKAKGAAITCPHDGYVAELNVKVGDVYDGSSVMLAVTAENTYPVLRADTTAVEKNIAKGAKVNISTSRNGTVETEISNVGATPEGEKYVDVQVDDTIVQRVGSIYSMTQQNVSMSLVYKAKETTCLIPSSAIRGTGEERYVFIVEQEYNSFGNNAMKVRKQKVTVLNEVNGTASVEEGLSYYTLAYMEDRQINDGDPVMEYTD